MDSDHDKILPHNKVKWLTAGRVLFRLREILLQIKTFLGLFSFVFAKVFISIARSPYFFIACCF
jgi:hypothetical protein